MIIPEDKNFSQAFGLVGLLLQNHPSTISYVQVSCNTHQNISNTILHKIFKNVV